MPRSAVGRTPKRASMAVAGPLLTRGRNVVDVILKYLRLQGARLAERRISNATSRPVETHGIRPVLDSVL